MKRAGLWAAVFVWGCSGGAPAKSAGDEKEAAPASPSEASEGATEGSHAESPPESAPKAAEPEEKEKEKGAESLSSSDLGAVLQAVLNDPELDGYLHAEKPGRTPVKLSGPDLPKDLKLVKGTHVVTLVDGPKSPKDPVIVLTKIELDGNTVTVAYRYDVENIRGTTRVKNGKSGWELMSSRIVEK